MAIMNVEIWMREHRRWMRMNSRIVERLARESIKREKRERRGRRGLWIF